MEVAGLAIGVAALFLTCVESFDIIVRSREFGNDFDLLCTQLALLQIRLKVWGESLGLVPENGIANPYACSILLEHADVQPSIERALFHLHRLLSEADVVTSRYVPEWRENEEPVSKGLTVFQKSFDLFKQRIRKNQKKTSPWKVTRWAIHDLDKFKTLITNIKDLIEALEGITIPLGSLWQHQQLLAHEVSLVSDTDSLRLLVEVSSIPGSSWSLRVVCDSSSYRLTLFTNSAHSATSNAANSGAASSYHTAPEQPLDFMAETQTLNQSLRVAAVHAEPFHLRSIPEKAETKPNHPPPRRRDVPQNQRIMRQIIQGRNFVVPEPSFASGDSRHGLSMTQVKSNDVKIWEKKGHQWLLKANNGGSVARRVFLELRSIRAAKIPFLSARVLGDSMDKILATIEGPPDTPYEGGIFFLRVHYQTADITQPPVLRFITRVYHPNIDCLGNICADYQDWWGVAHHRGFMVNEHVKPSNESWFSTRSCLGSILTAICSLLASPNAEDPLVPEIAETYVKDYERYCEIARTYTLNHAMDMELDEGYILSMDEPDLPAIPTKATNLRVSNSVKNTDRNSSINGSSISSSFVSAREKDKLLYDDEARSESRVLASLGGGSSSGSSSSSDDSGESHEDEARGKADDHHMLSRYLEAGSASLPASPTVDLRRATSFDDFEGIFDPEWNNDVDAVSYSRHNGKRRRRTHRSPSRMSPADGDKDYDEAHTAEIDDKLSEGLTWTNITPMDFHESEQARKWYNPFRKDPLECNAAGLSDEMRDAETRSISSAASTRTVLPVLACHNTREDEARQEMATLHSGMAMNYHLGPVPDISEQFAAGGVQFSQGVDTGFWSAWQPGQGPISDWPMDMSTGTSGPYMM